MAQQAKVLAANSRAQNLIPRTYILIHDSFSNDFQQQLQLGLDSHLRPCLYPRVMVIWVASAATGAMMTSSLNCCLEPYLGLQQPESELMSVALVTIEGCADAWCLIIHLRTYW